LPDEFSPAGSAGAQHEGAGARSVDGFCGSEDPVIGS